MTAECIALFQRSTVGKYFMTFFSVFVCVLWVTGLASKGKYYHASEEGKEDDAASDIQKCGLFVHVKTPE